MPNRGLEAHLSRIGGDAGGAGSIAFFDLDRTLIAGYSVLALAKERLLHGATSAEIRESARILVELAQARHRHGSTYHRMVRGLARSLADVGEDIVAGLAQQAYERSIATLLYSEAVALVEAHRAAGHRLVIVTAATRYQVEPIARALGIDDICCTELVVEDGRFTGEVVTPLCYGEGKAIAARRCGHRWQVSLDDCWFYSDSDDDLPLLEAVGRPVAVNPNRQLQAIAAERRWTALHFDSRGRPTLESVLRTALTLNALASAAVFGAIGERLGAAHDRQAKRLTHLVGDIGSAVAGLNFEVEGRQHLRQAQPAIYIFNHQSLLDAVVLANLLRENVVAMCKREIRNNPILGPLMQKVDAIFIDRDNADQSDSLRQALDVLDRGQSLAIAPEGTRSTLGELGAFKRGAFLLAKKAGVPIVPIVLHNVKEALPKGGLFIRPATIRITVLPPVQPETMGPVRQICADLEARYREILGTSPVAALPRPARRLRAAPAAA